MCICVLYAHLQLCSRDFKYGEIWRKQPFCCFLCISTTISSKSHCNFVLFTNTDVLQVELEKSIHLLLRNMNRPCTALEDVSVISVDIHWLCTASVDINWLSMASVDIYENGTCDLKRLLEFFSRTIFHI